MTGVEILAIEEVATKNAFNWSVFWIFFGVIFTIALIVGICISVTSHDWIDLLLSIIAGVLIGGLFGALFGSASQIPVEYETQYKVVISDEVLMNEFAEKYEIIDQEGKIYTVRDRE